MRRTSLTLVVAVSMGCASANDTSPAPAGDLTLSLGTHLARANGADLIPITVTGSGGYLQGRRAVTISASLGTLATSAGTPETTSLSISFDSAGSATALLRTGRTPGVAVIQACAGGGVIADTVRLSVAYPSAVRLGLGASGLVGSAVSSTTVTLQLFDSTAAPSLGIGARFTAIDSLGRPVGAFGPATPSDAAGAITTTYYAGPGAAPARVTITGTVVQPAPAVAPADSAIIRILP
jgi:hypothetical protein